MGPLFRTAVVFLLLSFFSANLFSAEKIISTLNNVDLYQSEKMNADGSHFGTDLYAINKNNFPVQVSIKLTNSTNTKNGLIEAPFIIEPMGKGYFGWVAQDQKDKESTWNVEWYVSQIDKQSEAQPQQQMNADSAVQSQ